MGEWVAMVTRDFFDPSLARSSLRNSNWREGERGGLGFVEDEDALVLATLLEEAEEAFAMGVRDEVRRR